MSDPSGTNTTIFESQRRRLVRLAYRMLGSLAEAEDIVQDAWIRWQRVDLGEVREPSAFLARTVTRLCLDQMKSARARHETYVGNWLPEPIVEPDDEALRLDELTLTLMLALERLSPLERAAFLLHDIFGVPLDEVAITLEREPAATRQLAARARKHVRDAGPRYPMAREEGDRIARAFHAASTTGDVVALRAMLARNAVLKSDGGGKVHAFLNPIVGLERISRLFETLYARDKVDTVTWLRPVWIDGLPGFVSLQRGGFMQTTALEIVDGRINAIYITRNPDKLSRLAAELGLEMPTP